MTRFIVLLASLSCAMGSLGCGGSSDGSNSGGGSVTPSGGGTLYNPYVLEVGVTYSVPVPGMRNLCGGIDPTCPSFNMDYTSAKGVVTQGGNYRISFTHVDANRDLVVHAYQNTGGGNYSFVAELDESGNGGNEVTTQPLAANTYMLFLASWGGADTIDVRIEKVP